MAIQEIKGICHRMKEYSKDIDEESPWRKYILYKDMVDFSQRVLRQIEELKEMETIRRADIDRINQNMRIVYNAVEKDIDDLTEEYIIDSIRYVGQCLYNCLESALLYKREWKERMI